MSKKYNIGKKSDMQRFDRDMLKKIECIAYFCSKAECPNCHSKVSTTMEYSVCPVCQGTICFTSQTGRF